MRTLLPAILLLAAAAGSVRADAGGETRDQVVLASQTIHVGTVLSLDETDLMFQAGRRGTLRMIPLAEVREIRFDGGEVRVFHPIEDPNPDEAFTGDANLRSSPYIRAEDLVLSRREVIENALPRGILAGTVATLFTTDGETKKVAFAAGFLVQFGISLAIGW
jgi:hypothetical protein